MKKATKRTVWAGVNLLAGAMTLALYLIFMGAIGSTFVWLERFEFAKGLYIAVLVLDAVLFIIQILGMVLPRLAKTNVKAENRSKLSLAAEKASVVLKDIRPIAEKVIFALLAILFIVVATITWFAQYPEYVGDTRETTFYPPLAIKGWIVGAILAYATVVRFFFNTKPARKVFCVVAIVAAVILFLCMGVFYAINKDLMETLSILLDGKSSLIIWGIVVGIGIIQSLPHVLRLIALRGMVK